VENKFSPFFKGRVRDGFDEIRISFKKYGENAKEKYDRSGIEIVESIKEKTG
jgi:hypothetical protein